MKDELAEEQARVPRSSVNDIVGKMDMQEATPFLKKQEQNSQSTPKYSEG